MTRELAMVLFENDKPVRVFSNRECGLAYMILNQHADVRNTSRSDAVAEIRKQVFQRTGGECEWCGARFTSEQMHLHEVVFRSHGGDISLENSRGICYGCHQGRRDAAHSGPRFGEHRG